MTTYEIRHDADTNDPANIGRLVSTHATYTEAAKCLVQVVKRYPSAFIRKVA